MQLEELKKLQSEVRESVRDFEQGVEQTIDSVKADLTPPPDAAGPAEKEAAPVPPGDAPPPAAPR
jgi:hypothetical protein